MRDDFYAKVKNRYVDFIGLNDNEKYSFLMTNADPYILVWQIYLSHFHQT